MRSGSPCGASYSPMILTISKAICSMARVAFSALRAAACPDSLRPEAVVESTLDMMMYASPIVHTCRHKRRRRDGTAQVERA